MNNVQWGNKCVNVQNTHPEWGGVWESSTPTHIQKGWQNKHGSERVSKVWQVGRGGSTVAAAAAGYGR